MFLLSFLLAITVDTKAVDKIMNDTIRAWHAPGAAVAIVVDDKVVYAKGYGVKELGGEAVTPDTLFQIASTTKAFTTTAMAMLVDEKKLAWDDAVRKHVAYFRLNDPCADSLITLRDIASHRTGLTRHDELWDNTPLTREDVIRAMANVKLTKPIRTTYQYQNIMFITAGEAVASASGVPWDDFVRTRIFEPLKMTSTRITDADWNASNHATGYRWDARTKRVQVQTPIDTQVIGAGGAIKSSARDMANWIRFHLADGKFEGRQLVSAEALNETKMPQTVIRLDGSTKTNNPESNLEAYGLGWVLQDYAGTLLVSHSGSLNGFRTHVDLLPKEKAGFVVLINIGRSAATVAMRNALTDLLLARPSRDWNDYYLTREAKLDADSEAKKAAAEAKRHRDTKPSRELAAFAGAYEHPAYGAATIAVENDALVLRWQRMTLPLTHWHYDTFTAVDDVLDVDEQVEFDLDAAGEVKTLKVFGQEFARK